MKVLQAAGATAVKETGLYWKRGLCLLILCFFSLLWADVFAGEHLLLPEDLIYLGAFRLPDEGERPYTFAYGGEAMTFRVDGNPDQVGDGLPGSLFVMGHNRLPYGELPHGNQVAEITIPKPLISSRVANLHTAQFLQTFTDAAAGFFVTLEEIPRVGMEYLYTPISGPQIHLSWGQHMQPAEEVPSHACFAPDLQFPNLQGPWYIGHLSPYTVNDYLFEIPTSWANINTGGRILATGRFKDGGWSGMGPSLIAYWPWLDRDSTPPPQGTRLSGMVLLLYANSIETDSIERCVTGYQHGDEWTGGAWITTQSHKEAVLFAGTKSTGDRYWYGFVHPEGPQYPFVEKEFLGEFVLCRLADGSPCPHPQDLVGVTVVSDRGWWSNEFRAQFLFYDPRDLALVAQGAIPPWEPQPYAALDIDEYLFLNPSGIDQWTLGAGLQRRYRLGDVAFDRENGYLYVLELFADEAKPVIHVWQVP